MKKLITISAFLFCLAGGVMPSGLFAQAVIVEGDSLKYAVELKVVTVSDDYIDEDGIRSPFKPTPDASTEDVIERINGVTLIRRGNYAAEPTYRGMSAGQLSITIDGMKIFGACTDKMDPVSSYVSANNLKSISVTSDANASCQSACVGGAIDMQTKTPVMGQSKHLSGSAGIGYHTNGNGRLALLNLNYSDSLWAIRFNGNYQKFDNYRAGGGEEINFTQFEKFNFSLAASGIIGKSQIMEATLIWDDANNVGYPALPMDVSYAGGRIYSLSYKKYFTENLEGSLKIKAYGNNITHVMDDTKRPDIVMHMDMPGWSNTYGVYALQEMSVAARHTLLLNPDFYMNRSKAEMTMYPENEKPMFMLTWPDVRRVCVAFSATDEFALNNQTHFTFSARYEWVKYRVMDEFGIKQLEAVGKDGTYPRTYNLVNGSVAWKHSFNQKWDINASLGYAQRHPTVTEGYGYYIFNSLDQYDYIGDPDLASEKSAKIEGGFSYKFHKGLLGGTVYYYQFEDYILGTVNPEYDAMTIGAVGVKDFVNLPSAFITGIEVSIRFRFIQLFDIESAVQYTYGQDYSGVPLPLIPPLRNISRVGFDHNRWSFKVEAIINTAQNNPRLEYGETSTPSYALLNIQAGYNLPLKVGEMHFGLNIDNLFDSYYWDHLDWNSIPRTGRSFNMNVSYRF